MGNIGSGNIGRGGNAGRNGSCKFGICGGNGGFEWNANVIEDVNKNVAATHKKTLNSNILTKFRCTARNGRMMLAF